MQSILDKLVVAGWLESPCLTDSTQRGRGNVHERLTPYGFAMLQKFKDVHDLLGDFADDERHALYDLMLHWITQSPERFE